MQELLISVIIPVFNSEKYLSECIKSVCDSTYKNLEIILVDDGSTDSSPQLCDDFSKNDSRIRTYHITNHGVSYARNYGVDIATGDLLVFLDSDDVLVTNQFDNCIKIILNQEVNMLISGFRYCDEQLNILSEQVNSSDEKLDGELACCKFMHSDLKTCMGSFIVKKSIAEKNSFSERYKYGEDLEYIQKCIINSSEIIVATGAMVDYRQNETSAIHKFSLSRYDNYYACISFKKYVELNHPSATNLLNVIDNFYIPETLSKDISLMCREGFSYRKLKEFLNDSGIQQIMDELSSNLSVDEEFRKNLIEWKNNSIAFYCKQRLETYKYLVRSTLAGIYRKVLGKE